MTVAKLIAALEKMPQEAEAFVGQHHPGYGMPLYQVSEVRLLGVMSSPVLDAPEQTNAKVVLVANVSPPPALARSGR